MKSHRSIVLTLVVVIGMTALQVDRAQAQSRACVHLLVGAWYAAEMRVVSGAFHTDWSTGFPIGQTICQPLSGVGDGHAFTVEVLAIAGKTSQCQPRNVVRIAASKSSVTFQAWGTTLNVQCEEPISLNAERDEAARTVSPEGQEAAKALKEAGS